jgi:hypothetical protein
MRMLAIAFLIPTLALAAAPASADEAELAARVERLSNELDALKAELRALRAQQAAPRESAPPATTAQPAASAEASTPAPAEPQSPATTFFGYGEANYESYRHDRSRNEADLARAVIGLGHRFDERTRFAAEFEWEHAIASADDQGESEVEQFYVERSFTPRLAARAGLFLIPSGMLNVSHEPTHYFGVTRNFVETAIIPTTWREGGIGVTGVTDSDLTWDVGLTTGFDLSKWDATSGEGRESPLGAIHQELQLAKAANLSAYGALNWRGYPGLLLGGSLFAGKAGQHQPDFPSQEAAVTLAEAHARWTPGPFDLSALYARGHISDTAAFNRTIVGNPTLVPQDFFGWYTQGAWNAWRKGDYQLTPFVRYERFNTGWKYASLPEGLAPAPLPTEGVTTLGASFFVTPNIVFKADYQWFRVDTQSDRFQLGLGLEF